MMIVGINANNRREQQAMGADAETDSAETWHKIEFQIKKWLPDN